MGDSFYRWSSSLARRESDSSFLPQVTNSFARPSGRSIYNQRRDYGQSLLKPQSEFQHHVEHLLTVPLGRGIHSTEDCLERLKLLEAQGRVWGQDLVLQVKDQELVLSDVESKEELDSYPLGSIQGCGAVQDSCSYDSVLAISVQERKSPGTSVLLFQCDRVGAETLKSSLEKLLKQWKEEQRGHYGHRSSLDRPPSPAPTYAAPERWGQVPQEWEPPRSLQEPPQRGPPSSVYSEPPEGLLPRSRGRERGGGEPSWVPALPPGLPDAHPTPAAAPPGKAMSETDRDVEVLNHVLSDLELFVSRLRRAEGLASSTKKKKKKKKGVLPPADDYRDFFQKVKYSCNLLARTRRSVQPNPPELLRLIFAVLSYVLDHCPDPNLAPAVESPLLLPEAVELLEETLQPEDYGTWKSLGLAWSKPRAEYPRGETVPGYVPVFSDGWLPPPLDEVLLASPRDVPDQAPPSPPGQRQVRALYDFQGRNPQELSIRMGDILQVLDQQRKWWLVQDSRAQRGYVPSNVLEPLEQEQGHGGRHSIGQDSPPSLLPDSPPAEVTAWLQDKGFSRITVRCLGVLSGQQLLQMRPEELRAVCPEEWRRVLFKLSPIKTSLGMGPRD
ncbi:epidermal growth factor receptor kinase substrate 8-like protein 3 [Pogoniulus pusillus]|uniref:epidermal growth factor receptor kinase substrate 8-like protein 3 n=1 Tax=Pogoniulus pusillus TaxID=488313 RepID=UPI0030B95463